jgi:acetolactate synthase I/II/III large subunit
MGKQVTAGQYIIKWMEQMEIDRFFFVPGESFLHVLDALHDSDKILAITARHESSAAFAAEAYGKLKGKPAVCMATRGPGASNLSIGVQTAYYDQTPMIALIGQVPTPIMQSGAFQEMDFVSFFSSISKEVFSITSARQLPDVLRQAYWLACNGRPGPVVITLPTDVLGSTLADEILPEPALLNFSNQENEIATAILEKLEKAEQPLIVSALPPIRGEESQLLAEAAELLGLPVCAAWRRFSSFPNDHKNFIGSVGLGSPKVTTDTVKNADCIIGFGQALEDIAVSGGLLIRDNAHIVQVAKHIDSGSIRRSGKSIFNGYIASEIGVLNALVQNCRENDAIRAKNAERTVSLHEKFVNRFSKAETKTEKSNLDVVFHELNKTIEPNAIVTSDAGNFSHWLLRFISFEDDRVYLGPVNGAMGYGIPSALGAKASFSDRPVWAFAGDGGAMMTIGDLETIARYQLDVTVIVINNGIYGTIRAHQEKQFPDRNFGTNIGNVDFTKIAEGMGWKSWKIEENDQIEKVLAEAVNEKGPRLIEVSTSVYPLSLS